MTIAANNGSLLGPLAVFIKTVHLKVVFLEFDRNNRELLKCRDNCIQIEVTK